MIPQSYDAWPLSRIHAPAAFGLLPITRLLMSQRPVWFVSNVANPCSSIARIWRFERSVGKL